MQKYEIVKESNLNKSNYQLGQMLNVQGLGACLVVGFSSETGTAMVFAYKMQKIIGII